MVAVTDTSPDATPAPAAVDGDAAAPARNIGVVPTASLLTGAAIATVWFWIPLAILIIGISSIPSGIGFALSVVMFVYLMRGVEHVERLRSEAVFGLRIGVPPRRMSPYTGIQRWLHQLWLDISSARFWKASAHHYLRMAYDMLAAGVALALLVFAFLGPAAAIAILHSDDDAGLSFMSPPLAWLLAFLAVVAAAAILVFAPAVDAVIDRWLLSPSPTAALQYQVSALADEQYAERGTTITNRRSTSSRTGWSVSRAARSTRPRRHRAHHRAPGAGERHRRARPRPVQAHRRAAVGRARLRRPVVLAAEAGAGRVRRGRQRARVR